MAIKLEIHGKSMVQQDTEARIASLLRLDSGDIPDIVGHLELLAGSRGYTRLTARVPAAQARHFVSAGYHLEASIPHFYREGETLCFLARDLDEAAERERLPLLLTRVLAAAEMQHLSAAVPLPEGGALRLAEFRDIGELSRFYRDIKAGKGAAVEDPLFLDNALGRGDIFLGVWICGALVAVCGAAHDASSGTAELAHFAVAPEHRGEGLALLLLQRAAELSAARGTRLLWSAVRAYTPGINITFARGGYRLGGTLTNGTCIFGAPESVNVWYKSLGDDPAIAWSSLFQGA